MVEAIAIRLEAKLVSVSLLCVRSGPMATPIHCALPGGWFRCWDPASWRVAN